MVAREEGGFVFSQTTEYALRAALALAAADNKPVTTREIASTMKVPPSYLAKVMQALMRSGVVHSLRGVKGGFLLQKKPSQLSLLEIVNAVAPFPRIDECPLGLDHNGGGLCGLHSHLAGVWRRLENDLAETTLGEILARDRQVPSLQERLISPES